MDQMDKKDKSDYKLFIRFDDMSQGELAAFNRILMEIYRLRGLDFRQYRPKCLRRRIVTRLHAHSVKSFAKYIEILHNDPQELDRLLGVMTINVSEFFRNPETFEKVRLRILPEILEIKKRPSSHLIRIWSAGCATGEEPYSIASIFHTVLFKGFKLRVLATDIDEDALAVARKGCYHRKELSGLNEKQQHRIFNKIEEDRLTVKPLFRDLVEFRRHNMISDPAPRLMDLVFCRNVVIYFKKELQRKVYENIHRSLNPGGFLVAGKVEAMLGVAEDLFEIYDLNERIYRKRN